MKPKEWLITFVLTLVLVLICKYNALALQNQQQIELIQNDLVLQRENVSDLLNQTADNSGVLTDLSEHINELSEQIESNRREIENKVSRGDTEVRRMKVTAYDLSYESCGKLPGHPEYGIGANGEPVKECYSVAMGKGWPFGTRIYIPYFSDWPNSGYFVCTDRGRAINDSCVDIFFGEKASAECKNFGFKYLDVYILSGGMNK